jgi:hypothetical protein
MWKKLSLLLCISCLERLRKTTETPSRVLRSVGRYLKQSPAEYEPGTLTVFRVVWIWKHLWPVAGVGSMFVVNEENREHLQE